MTAEPCGCPDRDGHAEPHIDPGLHIEHGERDELNEDPEPWGHCLCGHPDYLTCEAYLLGGGVMGLTLHNVGGYVLTTLPDTTEVGPMTADNELRLLLVAAIHDCEKFALSWRDCDEIVGKIEPLIAAHVARAVREAKAEALLAAADDVMTYAPSITSVASMAAWLQGRAAAQRES